VQDLHRNTFNTRFIEVGASLDTGSSWRFEGSERFKILREKV